MMFFKDHPVRSLLSLTAIWTLPLVLAVEMAQAREERQLKKNKETLVQEEQEDYYKKWLEQDVVYIITEEEKSVFKELSGPAEKEQFIEQFWYRRDPDPKTGFNEFKEEHYRRIAFSNERFHSGKPGWQSDRGRIYIIHGKPASKETYTAGSGYQRPFQEGGGGTTTYAWEKWHYHFIEGIGPGVTLEFVDKSMSGEFKLSFVPEDKDALLYNVGQGLTLAEEYYGLSKTESRPFFTGRYHSSQMGPYSNNQYDPITRYRDYSQALRPTEIKYKDLKELVNINISYEDLPFKMSADYIRLNEDQVLVPVTVELRNKDLTYKEKTGLHVAKVAVYGIITSITRRMIAEFEHDLINSFKSESLQRALTGRSLFQKIVPLDRKSRYRLDLVVKDVNSGHVGVVRRALIPPSYDEKKLSLSSLILSDYILPLEIVPREEEMFVLGDVKIRPSLSKAFPAQGVLGVYLQVYNAGIDQTVLAPSLQVTYRILQGDQLLMDISDESGEGIHYFSSQRVVLIKKLPLQSLSPGQYQLQVEIHDRISDEKVAASDGFQVKAPLQMAQSR